MSRERAGEWVAAREKKRGLQAPLDQGNVCVKERMT
ncbi:hypothetical protein LMG28690_03083 [Paraburkholderia caffeinilytica]|nr:hypothetical protein LMG28690_03083 [Paraburkholderia caffeinilytica]